MISITIQISSEELQSLANKCFTIRQIATHYGIQYHIIRKRLNELGIKTKAQFKRYDTNKIISLHKAGLTDREIAQQLSLDVNNLSIWLRKRGLPKNKHNYQVNSTEYRIKNKVKHIPSDNLPVKDPESLYCDSEFLSEYLGKEIKGKCN